MIRNYGVIWGLGATLLLSGCGKETTKTTEAPADWRAVASPALAVPTEKPLIEVRQVPTTPPLAKTAGLHDISVPQIDDVNRPASTASKPIILGEAKTERLRVFPTAWESVPILGTHSKAHLAQSLVCKGTKPDLLQIAYAPAILTHGWLKGQKSAKAKTKAVTEKSESTSSKSTSSKSDSTSSPSEQSKNPATATSSADTSRRSTPACLGPTA